MCQCALISVSSRVCDDHVNQPTGIFNIDLGEYPDHLTTASRDCGRIEFGPEAGDLKAFIRS